MEINDTKTEIYHSSGLRDDSWPRVMSRRLENYKNTKDDLFVLFEETFDVSEKMKNEAPVRYLLRRADKQKIFEDDHWEVIENFLTKCIYDYSHSTDYVARILVRRDIMFDDLDKNKWARVINNRLMHHIEMGHDHEVCWLLWATISLLIPLSATTANKLVTYPKPLVALMGAHAFSKKLIPDDTDITFWEGCIEPSQLNDEWWVFAYECSLRGWLKTNLSNASMRGTIFAHLKNNNISFYEDQLPFELAEFFVGGGAIPKTGFGYEDGEEEEVEDEPF